MIRIISPSILSADFGHLYRDTRMVDDSAAGWVHIDVMDGVFVPNISFGFPVLKAVRKATNKFLDVHLMIVQPEKYIARFAAEGAGLITVHLEATDDIEACLAAMRQSGVKSGISIKPATPVSELEPWLDQLDLVLVMSVEPGFGGQSFIPGSLDKIRELRRLIDERGLSTLIEVDGGISADNAREVFDAGADVLVAGAAVFGKPDPAAEIEKILNA
jgi:ribulose-phosphate 3-epimerase